MLKVKVLWVEDESIKDNKEYVGMEEINKFHSLIEGMHNHRQSMGYNKLKFEVWLDENIIYQGRMDLGSRGLPVNIFDRAIQYFTNVVNSDDNDFKAMYPGEDKETYEKYIHFWEVLKGLYQKG